MDSQRLRRHSNRLVKEAGAIPAMRWAAKIAGLMIGAGLISAPVAGTRPDPVAVQKSVDIRVAHYKEIGRAAKAIEDELEQSRPDLATIISSSRLIEALANEIPGWFPPETGPQPGVRTEALPAIWQQSPLFKQRAAALAGAARGLAAAAGSGNVGAVHALATNVGEACRACHDTFRQRK